MQCLFVPSRGIDPPTLIEKEILVGDTTHILMDNRNATTKDLPQMELLTKTYTKVVGNTDEYGTKCFASTSNSRLAF